MRQKNRFRMNPQVNFLLVTLTCTVCDTESTFFLVSSPLHTRLANNVLKMFTLLIWLLINFLICCSVNKVSTVNYALFSRAKSVVFLNSVLFDQLSKSQRCPVYNVMQRGAAECLPFFHENLLGANFLGFGQSCTQMTGLGHI